MPAFNVFCKQNCHFFNCEAVTPKQDLTRSSDGSTISVSISSINYLVHFCKTTGVKTTVYLTTTVHRILVNQSIDDRTAAYRTTVVKTTIHRTKTAHRILVTQTIW